MEVQTQQKSSTENEAAVVIIKERLKSYCELRDYFSQRNKKVPMSISRSLWVMEQILDDEKGDVVSRCIEFLDKKHLYEDKTGYPVYRNDSEIYLSMMGIAPETASKG